MEGESFSVSEIQRFSMVWCSSELDTDTDSDNRDLTPYFIVFIPPKSNSTEHHVAQCLTLIPGYQYSDAWLLI